MNRKIFSQKIIKSVIGLLAVVSIPFSSILSKNPKSNKSVDIKINPLAVRRAKPGDKNV